MATVSVADIITRMVERSGYESSAPGFTSDAERLRLCNALYRQLYNKLVDARGAEYFALATTFDTAAGVGVYPIATATGSGGCGMPRFFELLSIHIRANGVVRVMRQWEYGELDALIRLDLYGSRSWANIRYRVTDVNIEFIPKPDAVYTIMVRYVPTALELVTSSPVVGTSSTTIDGINGFEDWIVVAGAIAIREKAEHGDTSGLMAELARFDEQIEYLKSKRNAANAPRIVSRGNAWSLETFPLPFGFTDTDDRWGS
jgi:hypothetical protein